MSRKIADAGRLVIKIGSALLVDKGTGELRRDWLNAMADDIAAARRRGQDVLVVSSGAIALGRRRLQLPQGSLRLEESQAAAAVGQIGLAHAYQEALARHNLTIAQILLTIDDTEERRRYLNARSTLDTLLKLGAVPVINENDTVATTEIRFGDNDRLAARVAQMVSADGLALLSDIDGLYTADPTSNPAAVLIPEVGEITDEIEAMAGKPRSGLGSGGMITKIAAARIAMGAGCNMVIASGKPLHALRRIDEGAPATWFVARATPIAARKRWIGGSLNRQGVIVVDTGAVQALYAGKSLLPAGVVAIEGEFERGDAVALRGPDNRLLGCGLIAYSAENARRIMGHKSSEIAELLGYRGRDEMIHRDDLVLS